MELQEVLLNFQNIVLQPEAGRQLLDLLQLEELLKRGVGLDVLPEVSLFERLALVPELGAQEPGYRGEAQPLVKVLGDYIEEELYHLIHLDALLAHVILLKADLHLYSHSEASFIKLWWFSPKNKESQKQDLSLLHKIPST